MVYTYAILTGKQSRNQILGGTCHEEKDDFVRTISQTNLIRDNKDVNKTSFLKQLTNEGD